ncbi:hypothetical protein TVH25_19470 [Rhodococcus sp. 7Tela_A2]|uniref:hypothetical protein n=1 Tax=Rhodococcus sp. 7Tela_A2 TaxID=3093744 RepID=UPI003BB69ADC
MEQKNDGLDFMPAWFWKPSRGTYTWSAGIVLTGSVACIIASNVREVWGVEVFAYVLSAIGTFAAVAVALWVALREHLREATRARAETATHAKLVRTVYGRGDKILPVSTVRIINYGQFPITDVQLLRLVDGDGKDVEFTLHSVIGQFHSLQADFLINGPEGMSLPLSVGSDALELSPVISFVDANGVKWTRSGNGEPERVLKSDSRTTP